MEKQLSEIYGVEDSIWHIGRIGNYKYVLVVVYHYIQLYKEEAAHKDIANLIHEFIFHELGEFMYFPFGSPYYGNTDGIYIDADQHNELQCTNSTQEEYRWVPVQLYHTINDTMNLYHWSFLIRNSSMFSFSIRDERYLTDAIGSNWWDIQEWLKSVKDLPYQWKVQITLSALPNKNYIRIPFPDFDDQTYIVEDIFSPKTNYYLVIEALPADQVIRTIDFWCTSLLTFDIE